ncbi:hypothetical protein EGW08_015281 [Elysia chlorotica]|uniref:Uncharacterized protein n=1 Tax=Elysia chlorotica TaxID=188477 RepID=A0A433T5Z8_ELYCH|nr:hypothetical protein EGW08_015281 [Elysia chlorotica]
MSRFVLLAVVLVLTIALSYQAPLSDPNVDVTDTSQGIPSLLQPIGPCIPSLLQPIGPCIPIGPIRPIDPSFPIGPLPGGPLVVSKRSGDTKVDVEVNTGPKGTSGTVSGTHTTSGGTTIKGSISHGPGGTSGGVKVSVPIQG